MMISLSKSWLKPGWFLVIWFDLMLSCIPRNLHECTCRGSGRTWFGRARIPRLCRRGSWLCHVPTQDRQTPRRQTLWPSSWHGAHAHEPSHSETPRHQTRPTGTLIPSLTRSLVDFKRRNFSKEHFFQGRVCLFLQILEDICQKNNWGQPVYQLHSAIGPDQRQLFLYKVTIPALATQYPNMYATTSTSTIHTSARTLTLTVSQNLVSCLL